MISRQRKPTNVPRSKKQQRGPRPQKRTRAEKRDLRRRKAKTNNGWLTAENNQKQTRLNNMVSNYGPIAAKLAGGFVANKVASMIKGFGAYSVSKNSLLTGVPSFANSNGRFIFQRQEYLGDITPSEAFNIVRYPLNPGQNDTFPWLSNIARSFEQWKPHGIAFYFRSLSSPNVLSEAPNTSLGALIMSTQYDPKDSAFESKTEMENYWCTNSGPPYKDQIHPVECAKNQTVLNELLVRFADQEPDSDLSFYDLGNFDIATVGNPSDTGVIGELWITYCIEFMKPKVPEHNVSFENSDMWFLNLPSATRALGSAPPTEVLHSLGGVIDETGAGTVDYSNKLRAEDNVLLVYAVGGDPAALNGPTMSLIGFEYNTQWNPSPGYFFNGGTTSVYCLSASLKCTDPSACIITFVAGTILPASPYARLIITGINNVFTRELTMQQQIDKLALDLKLLRTKEPETTTGPTIYISNEL